MNTWLLTVGVHRFLVQAEQVAHLDAERLWAPVAHAPVWVAGLAESRGRWILGVDAGRFLGIEAAAATQLVVPWAPAVAPSGARKAADWGLCVSHCEAGPASDGLCPPPAGVEIPAAETHALPGFIGDWVWWQEGDTWHWAQALDLQAWLRHPRLLEALQ
jgi:hypothetical protein